MANGIIIGWNRPITGREKQAGELFGASLAYFGRLQGEGKLDSFEPVIIAAHGGNLNGFFSLKGAPEKLDALRHDNEFLKLVVQLGNCIDGLSVNHFYHGDRLMEVMGMWTESQGGA